MFKGFLTCVFWKRAPKLPFLLPLKRESLCALFNKTPVRIPFKRGKSYKFLAHPYKIHQIPVGIPYKIPGIPYKKLGLSIGKSLFILRGISFL